MLDPAAGWLLACWIRAHLEALTIYNVFDPGAACLARMLAWIRVHLDALTIYHVPDLAV